jgi:hypothetical protein
LYIKNESLSEDFQRQRSSILVLYCSLISLPKKGRLVRESWRAETAKRAPEWPTD